MILLFWLHPAMVDCRVCVCHTLMYWIWLNVIQIISLSHPLHFTNPPRRWLIVNFVYQRRPSFLWIVIRVGWGATSGRTQEFHIFAKKIMKWEPSQLTVQQNQRPILSLIYSPVVYRLRGVVVREFDDALPGEVDKMKIFRLGRVGDGDANFAKTICW